MVKIVASGLMIAAGWFCGEVYGDFRGKGFFELCGVIALLETMKNSISYSKAELYGIFKTFSHKSLDECGFLNLLRANESAPAGAAWQNAVLLLSMDRRIKDTLWAFGQNLGLVDFETQIEKLEDLIAFLAKERENMRETVAGKIKSYRYLGALAGCLAAIVLY